MSAWSAYWLGLLTPVLALACGYASLWVGCRVVWWAEARGWSIDLRLKRDLDGASDYTLRHDIWWERSFGPIFVGGWYREESTYEAPSKVRATRWVGLGSTTGPCLTFYRLRELGETP